MLYILQIIENYISYQLLHVTWNEFLTNLKDKVSSILDMKYVHELYVNNLLSRCFLTFPQVKNLLFTLFDLILSYIQAEEEFDQENLKKRFTSPILFRSNSTTVLYTKLFIIYYY